MIGGEADEFAMEIQGFVGRVTPGEETMFMKDRPDRVRMRVVGIGHRLGQREAGHDPRQVDDSIAVEFPADRLALDSIGDGQNRIGVTVVDETMRQKGVQQRFDRWRRSRRIEHAATHFTNHVFVGHVIECSQSAKSIEIEGRQSRCFDGGEIPSRTLDPDDVDVMTVHVLDRALGRGVSTTMEDERRVRSEGT